MAENGSNGNGGARQDTVREKAALARDQLTVGVADAVDSGMEAARNAKAVLDDKLEGLIDSGKDVIDQAAKSLGITESAYKVRLSRARKKVGDYLAPRCEHVNPMNPCRCPARVGTALAKGFIRPVGPVAGEVSLRKPAIPYGRYGTGPENDDAPMRDIAAIYGSLPEPDPPADLGTRLIDKLAG